MNYGKTVKTSLTTKIACSIYQQRECMKMLILFDNDTFLIDKMQFIVFYYINVLNLKKKDKNS